jgi:hypothetical protein
MSNSHVHRITRELGAEAVAETVGVSLHSVRAARAAGAFPANWYELLKVVCDERGIPVPLSAFNMKRGVKKPVTTKHGRATPPVQPNAKAYAVRGASA